MNFSKNLDNLGSKLAHSQAMIFEKSVEDGIPSKYFIKCFLLSPEAYFMDELNLDRPGITEAEIYQSVKSRIHTKKGQLLPFLVMHFIGYFYRAAAYLTNYTSKQLYQMIPVDLLIRNYVVLHSFAIEEAIREVFEMLDIKEQTPYEKFKEIYQKYRAY